MEKPRAKSAAFLLGFLTLLFANIILLALLRLYPFVDIPYHLAETTIYRHYDDPDLHFKTYYTKLNGFKPNTFHLIFGASKLFPDVETAYTVFFCLYSFLLPVSVFRAIRVMNGNIWISLLSFLLIYNFNVHWGFAGFFFSIPVFIFFYSAAYTYIRSVSLKSGAVVASLLLVVLLIHPLTALFSILFFVAACTAIYIKNLKTLFFRTLPAIPAILLTAIWWFSGESQGQQWNLPRFVEYFRFEYVESLPIRARLLWNDFSFLFEGVRGVVAGLAFSLCLLSVLIGSWRARDDKKGQHNSLDRFQYLLVIVSTGCWFLLPGFVKGQTHIFDRFSIFVLLSLILLAGYKSGQTRVPSWTKYLSAGAALIYTLLWSHYFYDFHLNTRQFNQRLFPDKTNKTLCGIIYDARFRGRRIYQHFPAYYITWKKGIACARFIDLRYSPAIRRKAGFQALPRYDEMPKGTLQKNLAQYKNVDYVLVKTRANMRAPKRAHNFKLIAAEPPWILYERNTLLPQGH